MSFRQCFRELRSVTFAALVVSSASLFPSSAITAQAPTTAVKTTSAPQTATITITNAGMVASTSVVTQGSSTLDYALYTPTVPVVGSCVGLVPYASGATCTVQYTFTPTFPFTRYGAVTLFDASGNVLGNTYLTGVGTGPQVSYPLSAATALTPLGSGFSTPAGIAVDATGNVYVADSVGNAVKEILASGGTIVTLGSGFLNPSAVAVDGAGNVFVADTGHNAVKEIVAVNGTIPATPTIVTLASAFTFSNPQGVAVDGSGNVYVADTGNSAVEQIGAVNGVIPAAATPVSLGAAGSFVAPNGVAVDASGNVYVTDSNKTTVREIVAVAGSVSATSTVTNLGSGLLNPQGVAVDGSGNVFVSDLGNKGIKEFMAGGATVTLGSGYTSPTGVAVDASGDVFVADGAANNAVEELNAQTPPSLSFNSTVLGATSSDSPKSFTLLNIGNAALTFPSSGSGANPAISASFSVGAGNTCPQVASGGATGSLAAGTSCVDSVSFTPLTSGPITGSLISTDNNLNASATQTIALSGTATPGTPVVTVTSPSATVNATTVTLSASVAYAGVAPGGAVTFSVNSGAPVTASCTGSASPRSCTATYNPSSLTVASYTIVATIAADTNYNTASGNGTLFITQGTPAISLAAGGSSPVDATVTFYATVTPSSGITPVGPVSFSTTVNGATTVLCATATLSAGSASCQTTALTFGANSITATLAGDTNFISVTSAPITQTVTAATTTLTLSSPGSSTVDSAVLLTATLSGTSAFTVTPTGTVSFSANGTPIALCAAQPLSTSTHTATCSATALVAPSDSITATYTSTSNNFSGSTALAFAQSMTKDTTAAAVVSTLPTTAVVNQTVTFTATVTPTNASALGVTPTGSVTFTNGTGGPTLCSGAVVLSAGANGTGTASCSTAFGAAMSSTNINATYTGDTNFSAATPAIVGQIVLAAATTTAVTSSPNPAAVNATVTLTPTVVPANSGAGFPGTTLPNGIIAVFDTGVSTTTPICSYTVTNGAVGTCSTPVIFATSGQHTLSAVFTPNDSNFRTSTSASYIQNVSTSSLTLTVSNAGSSSLTVNQSATFAATFPAFTAGQTIPSGTVAYYDSLVSSTVAISGCSALPVSGTGTIPNCPETLLAAGTHVISATFSPSTSSFQTTYSNQLPQVVAQSATTAAITAPTAAASVDQVVTFTATVTPSTTGPGTTLPTGTIAFTALLGGSTSTLCTAALPATGGTSASCTASFLAPGSYTVNAKYSGDTNFATSALVTRAETVNTTGTSLGLTSSGLSTPAQPAVNQSALYTVQLTLANSISDTGLTVPTGSVVLKDPATNVTCTAPISTTGQASCSLAEPTASTTHSIVATYAGDTNFGGSTNTFTQVVVMSATSIAASSISTNPSSPAVDQTGVVLNATIAPANTGSALPGGTVTFSDAATGITTTTCVSNVTSGVVAPCSHVFTSAGTHTITAVYSGDSNFSGITQTSTVIVGSAGAITLNVASTTPTITVNQSATFTAAFSPVQTGPSYPVGSVQFYDGATAIPGCNPNVSSTGGIANCTEVMTAAGTHVISAVFTSTDANFSSLTSGNLAQAVAQNSTKSLLTAPTATSTTDQQVTFAGTVTPGALSPAGTGTSIPTGTISFTYTLNGVSTTICANSVATVAGVTSATCTAPFTSAGAYLVVAAYSGDGNFQASTSPAFSDAVGKTGTSVTLVQGSSTLSAPSSPAANQSATYSVQIALPGSINDSGLTTPTGNVVFSDAATGAGCTAVVIATTGIASCSFADTVTGAHTIVAAYTGDNNFSASSQTFSTTVASSATTLSLSVNPSTVVTSQVPVAFNATITPGNSGSALPTGTVLFTDVAGGVTSTCTSAVTSGVVAPCAHVFTTGGVHTISAAYSGDNNFTAVTQTTPFTVGQATPAVSLISSVPQSVSAQNLTFTATVTPPYTGAAPTGTISFSSSPSSTVFSTCAAVPVVASAGISSATCNITFPQSVSGTFIVTAAYSGDSNYKTASMTATQVVQSFNVVISVNPTSIVVSQVPVTLNATLTAITSGAALPSGSVLFTDTAAGVSSTCTSAVTSGVVAPCPHVFTTGGVHSITAAYSGDTNFGAVTQTVSFTVGLATPAASVISSLPTSIATQSVTFSASVTPPYTGASPTGTIAFTATPSSTVLTTLFSACAAVPVIPSSGTASASCTLTFPNTVSGAYAVTATYSGDGNYKPAASTLTQNVQNFSLALTPAAVVVAQGNTNLTDPYLPTPIAYSRTALDGFIDTTGSTCATAVTGLTCTISGTAVVVTASLSVAPGIYPITVTTSDTTVGHTTLAQTVSTSVTVISRAYPGGTIPYEVPTAGSIPVSFTVLPNLAGSTYTCNARVANLDPAGSGNYLLGADTLSNLGLACSSIVAGSGGNTYTFTITAGSGTFANLEPSPVRPSSSNRILAAGLIAPILLAFGFSRRARKARKAWLRNLAIALVTLAALQTTIGCGGGFTKSSPASIATAGSYLIGISNAQGATVAEIPLIVAGNQ